MSTQVMVEESNKFENLLSEEEVIKHLEYLKNKSRIETLESVKVFKSLGRAIRRGNITNKGYICPSRPFHNKKNTSKRKNVHSRKTNELKKQIYEQLIGE